MKTLIKSALMLIMAVAVTTAAAQPRQRGGNATPEDRAKYGSERLTKELGLNEKQEKQVYDLYLKMDSERPRLGMKEGQKPTDEQREAMKAEMNKRHEKMQAEMKKILTPEQYTQWEANRAARMKNMQGMGQGRKMRNSDGQNCPYRTNTKRNNRRN